MTLVFASGNPVGEDSCPLCKSEGIRFSLKALLSPQNVREIYECLSCESFFYFPIPSKMESQACYADSYYTDFFAKYWNEFYKGRKYAKILSRWRAKGKFLDVGSSIGTLLKGIQHYSHWEVFGLEISPRAVEIARKLHGIELFNGNLFQSPWPDESFDYILINNVLEHVPDPVRFLKKAVSLLKTQGRLEIVCPNGAVDILPNKILFEKKGVALPTAHSGHLFFFSRKALGWMLAENGLRVLSFLNFHFKSGWKARGFLPPNALKKFEKRAKESSVQKSALPMESVPPKNKSWFIYQLQSAFQFFLPAVSWGYDFKILCEKARSEPLPMP